MAVIGFTGLQGAGKTYHVVHSLSLGQIAKGYYVVHNLDGLNTRLVSEDWIGKSFSELGAKNLQEGFTVKFLAPVAAAAAEKYHRPLLVIIDEAWRLLRAANVDYEEVLAWHRHEGAELWLIYQGDRQVHRNYQDLIQYIWRADNPYLNVVPGRFRYRKMCQGEVVGTKLVKKNKAVYSMYKSRERKGGKEEKTKMMWYVIALTVFFVGLASWFLKYGVHKIFAANRPPEVKERSLEKKELPVKEISKEIPKEIPKVVKQEKKDTWNHAYTYSSCVGGRIYVQNAKGSLMELSQLEEVSDYQLIECDGYKAVYMAGGGIHEIRQRRGLVKVDPLPQMKEEPNAASGETTSEASRAGALKAKKNMLAVQQEE